LFARPVLIFIAVLFALFRITECCATRIDAALLITIAVGIIVFCLMIESIRCIYLFVRLCAAGPPSTAISTFGTAASLTSFETILYFWTIINSVDV
jgi:hypothetical protein